MNTDYTLDDISKSLFIPLAVRAAEINQQNPVIQDEKSVSIIERTDTGDLIINGGQITTHGILSRTKVIDDEIRNILLNKPDTTIINLGAGLDTRICRLDNGKLRGFELDLPDAITLRRKFFEENDRIRFIAKSVLDDAWVQEIGDIHGQNIVILAEGLLMYFPPEDICRIFGLLSEHFPGADMYFDVMHSFFIGKSISSPFCWGLDKAKDIEALNPSICLLHSWSTGDLLKNRQSLFFRIMNILPSTRNRSQILHIQFKKNITY